MQFSQKTLFISRLALIVTLAIVLQIAGLPQPITGPIINALLFLTTALIGFYAGITLGCLTPLVAVVRGQLPPLLAPFIPFIAISNAILIIIFYAIHYKLKINRSSLKKIKIYLAIIIAAAAKFLFLSLAIKLIFPVIFNYSLPEKFAALMMMPQLFTALAGGILFLLFAKLLKKAGLLHN